VSQPRAYPPEHHVLRDLGLEIETTPDNTARAWMDVSRSVAAPWGGVTAGVLATMVDAVCGNLAVFAALPDRVATADLALTVLRPADGPQIEAAGRVIRRGRTTVVVEVDLSDVAWASATFAVLPQRADTPGPVVGRPTRRRALLGGSGRAIDRWLGDQIGLTVTDAAAGALSIGLSDYVTNSFGALQGGMVAFVAEQAGATAIGVAPRRTGDDGRPPHRLPGPVPGRPVPHHRVRARGRRRSRGSDRPHHRHRRRRPPHHHRPRHRRRRRGAVNRDGVNPDSVNPDGVTRDDLNPDVDELGRVDGVIGLERGEVDGVVVGRIPIADHTRGPGGGLRAGVLLTAVDAVGGLACGLASLPAWIVSTNLMVRVGRLDHTGPLRLRATMLRKGRVATVAAVSVHDEGADDEAVAHGILTSAVLTPAGGPPRLDRPVRISPSPLTAPGPLDAMFGIEPGQGPLTVLRVKDSIRNRWGILHGGGVALLADVAATRAVGGQGAAADAVVHYLRPVRSGPVEARCRVAGIRTDATVVIVSMYDRGNDDRQVALASVTVRRGPGAGPPSAG
jgi:uncharacterized protein (TIGR00369 family)